MANEDLDKGGLLLPKDIVYDEKILNELGRSAPVQNDTTTDIYRSNGFSRFAAALTSSLYGLDISGSNTPAPQTIEQYGLVFFTRPMINLSYDNITAERSFSPMLTHDRMSVAAFVQATLDPLGNHSCPLVDPYNAFIPLLSNTLQSLSGWQDPILDTFVSSPGLMRQQYSLGDSPVKVHGVYPLSATFRNVRGNALGYLFHVWTYYISLSYYGVCDPYTSFMRNNITDYQTRIYKLVLDPTRTYVEEIVSCYAAFPLVNPVGIRGNMNTGEILNRDVDVMSQTFQAQGATYYDPVSIYEFNVAATALNKRMRDPLLKANGMRRLWPSEYKVFSYRAYPFIDPETAMLQWWVTNETHREIMGVVSYPPNNLR